MHFMFKIRGVAVTIAMCGVAWLSVGPTHAASGEEVIKARVNFMEQDIGSHWKPLAAFGSKGIGSLADVEKNAAALAALAKKIPEHFPKDTGRGKYPDKLTRALPVIWENPEGFKKAVQRLADESEKLARLARDGKKDEVIDMIGKSGSYQRTKIGCAECHNDFRGERVK
jgi:cytochrome c556